jgi:hypothetical protein
MTPYRQPPEEVVLGLLLAAIGGVRVGIALATGETWRGESSLALLLLVLGVVLLAR